MIPAMTSVGSATRTAPGPGVLVAGTSQVRQPAGPDPEALSDPGRRRWWQQEGRPAWSVPARVSIFGLAALLYTWDLSRVGMGNTFYAAAVKSGTESWKALFFGSLDPGSFITVDKPPVALWVMDLSGRLFGFSTWSMLLPEALAGVATVMVLYNLVRRWFGEPAAALSAMALTLTPVAVVIFRVNDPDALLTLLLVLAAWAWWQAMETAATHWLVLSGFLVGLAFLTKSLDAFVVVPALGLAYLWCGPPHLGRRIGQLGWAALALVVSSAWWVAIVELWPENGRPYIGGSTDNSELNLIFGYNGFSRISGSGGIAATGASGGPSAFGGGQGLLRMFNSELGGQISWLLPLAILGLIGGLCLTRGRERTDRERSGFVLWGATLLMYVAVYDDAVRDLPSVLHRRHGAGRGGVGRSRLRCPLAAGTAFTALGVGAPDRHRGHGGLGGGAPRPYQWLRPVAGADCRHRRDRLGVRPVSRHVRLGAQRAGWEQQQERWPRPRCWRARPPTRSRPWGP